MQTIKKMLRELDAAGFSNKKVAAAIGVGATTISRWKNGVQMPHQSHLEALCNFHRENAKPAPKIASKNDIPADRITAMIAMHQRGYNFSEIGEVFGISRQRAQQIVSKHDGKPRRQ